VFNPPGDNGKLPFRDPQVAVAQLDQQPAFNHQEELVFILVQVPDKLAFDLDELQVRVVDFAGDSRLPVVLNQAEFLSKVDNGQSFLSETFVRTNIIRIYPLILAQPGKKLPLPIPLFIPG
jgi:hypothetical protein